MRGSTFNASGSSGFRNKQFDGQAIVLSHFRFNSGLNDDLDCATHSTDERFEGFINIIQIELVRD